MQKCATRLLLVCSIATVLVLFGCAKPEQQQTETRPEAEPSLQQLNPQLAAPRPSPTEKVKQPPPTTEEVSEAVKRVFKDVVIADTSHSPYFVAGDFNADGSEDLAVAVKPADTDMALLGINDELANWLIREPKKVIVARALQDVRANEIQSKPGPIRKGDELIAIIHGFGATGWRDSAARQTFLLKDVVGSNMRAETVKDLEKNKADLPLVNGQMIRNGDVIAQTQNAKTGLIFWTGSQYSWYWQGGGGSKH
jgi:hypothetical protein